MSYKNETRIPMDVQQEDRRKESLATPVDLVSEEKRQSHPYQGDGQEGAPQPGQVFDVEYIRDTIIEQERVFREQVRELHRVHRVQTILMAEMRNKERDFASHSSLSNIAIPRLSPSVSVNSGRWNRPVGEIFPPSGKYCDTPLSMSEPLKGSISLPQRASTNLRSLQEENLFSQNIQVTPVRRTFDLERPPEDEDEDQIDHKDDESSKPDENCVEFMGSPALAKSDPESDITLNLSSGWSQGKPVNDDKGHVTETGNEVKSSKRPREEAALFPFLATNSENLRDASACPIPTPTPTSSFLGGLWGLQLGKKTDSSSSADGISFEDGGIIKRERRSLNLELEERVVPASPSNAAPHWLLKAPAANPSKKAVCQTESSSLNFQHSVSPPRNSSEQGMIKLLPPQSTGESEHDSTPGLVWHGDRRTSDTPAGSQSHFTSSVKGMSEEDVYQVPVADLRSLAGVGAEIGPLKHVSKVGNTLSEVLPQYPSWKDAGKIPCRSISHNCYPNHPVSGGFGLQMRDYDGYRGLPSAHGLVQVGPAVNVGAGSAALVPDSSPGVWYQERALNSQAQQYQQQQQHSSPHNGTFSPCGSPWQVPMPTPQNVALNGAGTLYVRATPGSTVSHPGDGLQKPRNQIPNSHWVPGDEPSFTPISIVAAPKPPFEMRAKFVVTHDETSTELKLVSPQRQLSTKVVETSVSGFSDEDPTNKRGKGANDHVDHGRVEDESGIIVRLGRNHETDTKSGVSWYSKDKSSWMIAKHRPSGLEPEGLRAGKYGAQLSPGTVLANSHEGMDDADGGSSDGGSGGSGGSGVGDVINPGDRGSPSLGTLSIGESNRYLPAGDGEEGINMGEIGLEADSGSQSSIDGKVVHGDKVLKYKEDLISQEALFTSANYGSRVPSSAMLIALESSDRSSFVFEKRTAVRGAFTSEEEERRPTVFRHVLDQSCSSKLMKSFCEKGNRMHDLFPERQSPVEFRMTQLELDQPFGGHASKTTGYHIKEGSKLTTAFPCGQGSKLTRELQGGRAAMDVDIDYRQTKADQRKVVISDFVDVCKQEREIKACRSKQLSGSMAAEKDVQRKPYSPVLLQIPSPSSTVNLARHAEGSSKKVSQASETVQENGRSPLRGSRWIGPMTMEQDRCYYPGGVSSFEEVGGTLVKGFQQGNPKGKDLSLGRMCITGSMIHNDLGRTASAMVVTNPSSYGKGISTATKAPQYVKGDSTLVCGSVERLLVSAMPQSDGQGQKESMLHTSPKKGEGGRLIHAN